jgi:hypothetical protein
MLSNIARKPTIKAGCLIVFGLLTTSMPAAARDGTMPFDTLVCHDKGIILGFADRMLRTTPDEFWDYVGDLVRGGSRERIGQGEAVAFTELPDGRTCVARHANEPCYWSVARADAHRLLRRARSRRRPGGARLRRRPARSARDLPAGRQRRSPGRRPPSSGPASGR